MTLPVRVHVKRATNGPVTLNNPAAGGMGGGDGAAAAAGLPQSTTDHGHHGLQVNGVAYNRRRGWCLALLALAASAAAQAHLTAKGDSCK